MVIDTYNAYAYIHIYTNTYIPRRRSKAGLTCAKSVFHIDKSSHTLLAIIIHANNIDFQLSYLIVRRPNDHHKHTKMKYKIFKIENYLLFILYTYLRYIPVVAINNRSMYINVIIMHSLSIIAFLKI